MQILKLILLIKPSLGEESRDGGVEVGEGRAHLINPQTK